MGFIVAARAISMSDLIVTGLVPPKSALLGQPDGPTIAAGRIFPRRYWRFERQAQVSACIRSPMPHCS
jgi:hypothetical protein